MWHSPPLNKVAQCYHAFLCYYVAGCNLDQLLFNRVTFASIGCLVICMTVFLAKHFLVSSRICMVSCFAECFQFTDYLFERATTAKQWLISINESLVANLWAGTRVYCCVTNQLTFNPSCKQFAPKMVAKFSCQQLPKPFANCLSVPVFLVCKSSNSNLWQESTRFN